MIARRVVVTGLGTVNASTTGGRDALAGALALVRQRNQAAAQRLAFAGSIVVMAAGAYWFVERVFFAGGAG